MVSRFAINGHFIFHTAVPPFIINRQNKAHGITHLDPQSLGNNFSVSANKELVIGVECRRRKYPIDENIQSIFDISAQDIFKNSLQDHQGFLVIEPSIFRDVNIENLEKEQQRNQKYSTIYVSRTNQIPGTFSLSHMQCDQVNNVHFGKIVIDQITADEICTSCGCTNRLHQQVDIVDVNAYNFKYAEEYDRVEVYRRPKTFQQPTTQTEKTIYKKNEEQQYQISNETKKNENDQRNMEKCDKEQEARNKDEEGEEERDGECEREDDEDEEEEDDDEEEGEEEEGGEGEQGTASHNTENIIVVVESKQSEKGKRKRTKNSKKQPRALKAPKDVFAIAHRSKRKKQKSFGAFDFYSKDKANTFFERKTNQRMNSKDHAQHAPSSLYDPCHHFAEYVRNVQAKGKDIDSDTLNEIKTYMDNHQLDEAYMNTFSYRSVLKQIGRRDLYNHIPKIRLQLWNTQPIQFTSDEIVIIMQKYTEIAQNWPKTRSKRNSMLKCSMNLKQICDAHNIKCERDIPPLISQRLLTKQKNEYGGMWKSKKEIDMETEAEAEAEAVEVEVMKHPQNVSLDERVPLLAFVAAAQQPLCKKKEQKHDQDNSLQFLPEEQVDNKHQDRSQDLIQE